MKERENVWYLRNIFLCPHLSILISWPIFQKMAYQLKHMVSFPLAFLFSLYHLLKRSLVRRGVGTLNKKIYYRWKYPSFPRLLHPVFLVMSSFAPIFLCVSVCVCDLERMGC